MHPEFNLVRNSFSYSGGTMDHIRNIFLKYQSTDFDTMWQQAEAMNDAIDEVLAWVPADASRIEQIKAVHDWLVRNVSYDNEASASFDRTGSKDSYCKESGRDPWSAYGALVDHRAVCQGYALAFGTVLDRLGIRNIYCYSVPASHVWNYVEVVPGEVDGGDAAWFHVDVTWDDPVPDGGFNQTPRTTYFLRSSPYFRNLRDDVHDEWDGLAGGRCPFVDRTQLGVEKSFPSPWPTYSGPVDNNMVVARNDLSDATIAPIPDQPYDGYEWHPLVEVTLDGELLSNAEDYRLYYRDNVEVGTATVVVQGRNGYKGSVEATFQIVDKVNIEDCDVEEIPDQVYTGSAIEPELDVTYDMHATFGAYTLYEDSSYTVTYKNNTNVGTAKAIVKALEGSRYRGSKTVTFQIVPASIASASMTIRNQVYTGKPLTPAPTVKLNGKTLVEDVDYTVSYKNNTNVGNAIVTITGMGNYTGKATGVFKIAPVGSATPADAVAVYRLYNYKTSEHLWTTSVNEYRQLPVITKGDWRQEDIAWMAPDGKGEPVYRLYNRAMGDHYYSKSQAEINVLTSKYGWTVDNGGAAAFWSADPDGYGVIPLYCVYNSKLKKGQHHFTRSVAERDFLVANAGWRYEKEAFYGYVPA